MADSAPDCALQGKAGQEALWKHARRTLGDEYYSFLLTVSPSSQPIETTNEQDQNEATTDPQSRAYSRRRDQIRRSQRWGHSTATSHSSHTPTNGGVEHTEPGLNNCVALVKSLHHKLGQAIPEYAYDRSVAGQVATSSQISSRFAASEQTSTVTECRSESTSAFTDARRFSNTPDAQHITDILLNSEVALEFVVGVEAPCLDFVRQDLASQTAPSTSESHRPEPDAGCAMRRELARDSNPLAAIPTGTCASRLLALSSRLNLGDGLITPIQAWDKIKAHPRAYLISSETISKIINKSQHFTSCHRHGAVLDGRQFEQLLDQMLG